MSIASLLSRVVTGSAPQGWYAYPARAALLSVRSYRTRTFEDSGRHRDSRRGSREEVGQDFPRNRSSRPSSQRYGASRDLGKSRGHKRESYGRGEREERGFRRESRTGRGQPYDRDRPSWGDRDLYEYGGKERRVKTGRAREQNRSGASYGRGMSNERWRGRPADEEWKYEAVGEYIFGMNTCMAALSAGRRKIHKIYLHEKGPGDRENDYIPGLGLVKEEAARLSIPVEKVSRWQLNTMVGRTDHQRIIFDVNELPTKRIESLREPLGGTFDSQHRAPVLLCLDSVTDPHNLGALIRTSFFLGCNGVVVTKKNSAPLNPVVSRVSVGALEHSDMFTCSNMPDFLTRAASNGWQVIGTSVKRGSVPLSTIPSGPARPTLVVFGNECYGMRTNIERSCTSLVKIPGSRVNLVDSLNVATSAAVVLSHLISEENRVSSMLDLGAYANFQK